MFRFHPTDISQPNIVYIEDDIYFIVIWVLFFVQLSETSNLNRKDNVLYIFQFPMEIYLICHKRQVCVGLPWRNGSKTGTPAVDTSFFSTRRGTNTSWNGARCVCTELEYYILPNAFRYEITYIDGIVDLYFSAWNYFKRGIPL